MPAVRGESGGLVLAIHRHQAPEAIDCALDGVGRTLPDAVVTPTVADVPAYLRIDELGVSQHRVDVHDLPGAVDAVFTEYPAWARNTVY